MIDGRPTRVALGLLAIVAVSMVFWSPVLRDLDGQIAGGNGDPLLVAYLVNWVADHLGTLELWNPPFFHPAPNVLAYTDHMIGLALLAWPALHAGVSPVVTINVIGLLAFLFTAIAIFVWLLDDRAPVFPALAAALTVTFGAWREQQVPHPQLLFMPFLPLALLCYRRAFARDDKGELRRDRSAFARDDKGELRRDRPAVAREDDDEPRRGRRIGLIWIGAAALSLQTLFTVSLSVFLLPLAALWILVTGVVSRQRDGVVWLNTALSFALVALANLPFAVHYLAQGGALERSPVEIARFSAAWVDWVSARATHWLYGDALAWTRGTERELFPGLGFLLVLAIGIVIGMTSRGGRWSSEPWRVQAGWAGLVTGVVALWASTGLSASGGITLVHLPYDLLHAFVPGVRNVRAPVRFVILAGLFLAPVIAVGWAQVIGAVRRRLSSGLAAAVVAIVLLVIVLAEAVPGLAWHEPAADLDLEAVPEHLTSGGVVFLPAAHPDGPRRDIARMWAARRSGVPLVNGYSGHTSLLFDLLGQLERAAPDADTRRGLYSRLLHVDVDTIIVDPPAIGSPLIDPFQLRQIGDGLYRIPSDLRPPAIQTVPLGSGLGLLLPESGWSYPERGPAESWVWSLDSRTTLLVPMDGTPRQTITLRARGVDDSEHATLALWWNGRSLGAQRLRGMPTPLTYTLPAAATRPGWTRFEIQGPAPRLAGQDVRRLSVCLFDLTLQ